MKEKLSRKLAQNVEALKNIFQDSSDVVYRSVQFTESRKGLVVYIEGMIDTKGVEQHIIAPLIEGLAKAEGQVERLSELPFTRIPLTQMATASDWTSVIEAILTAHVVIFMDDSNEVLTFDVKGGSRRSVQEPSTETVIRGPREGFTESLRINTALLRFKIKTEKMKLKSLVVGRITKTDVAVAYIDGLAKQELVDSVVDRLQQIDMDGILESGYIEEWIEDNPSSPFPQMQYSERPDTIAAQLLEGKIAIFVDGTPFVLVAPVTLWQLLQSSEDYYERYFIVNFIRWIRLFFLVVALILPGLYIAVTTYHQDMLPSALMLSIATAREGIPFPVIIEALIMEISFEALQEAGIRLPKTIGQAVSILGALVIGQASVQAGIVSAPMVIVVSMTGIASFTLPRFNLAVTVRMLRFIIMFLAAVFGLFGIVVGTVWIVVHLTQLKSFGVPYLTGVTPYRLRDFKDIFVRVPMWKMEDRPHSSPLDNRRRIGAPKSRGRGEEYEGW